MPNRNIAGNAPTSMGNTSSQPCPPSTGKGINGHRNSPSQGKKKRPSGESESGDSVRESVQALKRPEQSRLPTPESLQDSAAASAQLVKATFSAAEIQVPATFQNSDSLAASPILQPMERGKTSRKRRSSALQPSSDAGNLQVSSQKFSPQGSSKGETVGLDGIIEDGPRSPQPTWNLDDIDENEEGLASLFQEYETQLTPIMSHNACSPEYSAQEGFHQNIIDPALITQSLDEKRKEKRKRRSSPRVIDAGAEQELLSGSGQHAFDIDFDAFDEIFANEGMQIANPFNEKSDHDFPNGAEPYKVNLSHIKTGENAVSHADSDFLQHAQNTGELPSIASTDRPRKRKRTEVPNSLDSQIPKYVSPYPPTSGQKDEVLLGIEEMQARSSSEVPQSRPNVLYAGVGLAATESSQKQNPPPRLEKPSKPRGNKKQRGGKKGKDYDPPLQELSDKGGMFTNGEIQVLDRFRDQYCADNHESHWRFNELIQSNVRGNPEAARLFIAIHDEMSYRTRQSITRFCRRHFHNFSVRGVWTETDDIELKDAVEKKGNSWKAVGAMINRFPEDCRDRYRNYLVNGDKRNKDTWVPEEVLKLVKAVDCCMGLLREQRLRAKEEKYQGHEIPESASESDQAVEDMKLINWQVVSDRMGGTRSRLQCSYKWNHLKNADRNMYLRQIRRLEKGTGLSPKAGGPGSWRLRKAKKKLNNMKPGDKYDILQAFADCTATTERDIPWMSLGNEKLRKRWSVTDLKAALEIFKSQIPGSENMNYQEIVNRVFTRLMADDPNGFDDHWDPEIDGDVNQLTKKDTRKIQDEQNRTLRNGSRKGKALAGEERRLRLKRKLGGKSKIKSKMFVYSEDEGQSEEEQGSEHEQITEEDEAEERNSRTNTASSAEKESRGRANFERNVLDEDGSDGHPSKKPSTASSEDEGTPADPSPCPVRPRSSPQRAELDETSSVESDNSLFNDDGENDSDDGNHDGIGTGLVDRLQLVRDAL
ncbi:MAG: hypothetical protein Q9170_001434 [Blastenia crenularia]